MTRGDGVATRVKNVHAAAKPGDVFAAVGAFLTEHALNPEPANYALAYDVICDPNGSRGREVQALTLGGVRLSGANVVRLGGVASAVPLALVPSAPAREPAPEPNRDDALVARTLTQIVDFATTLQTIHQETNHFGRDLAETAEAIRNGGAEGGVERISRLTAAMIARVHQAETRLEQATTETAELRAALEEARTIAGTDPLTGLLNRRAFDDRFAALSPDVPVALAICDIDHFKRVNDGFGHAVGDRVLTLVAQLLEREVECTVARYGGEEFALLFERCGEDDVVARIEAARDAVVARRLRDRDSDRAIGTINFSAGVARGVAGDRLNPLMERADRALYAAKQAGRGRTIVAP